MQLHIELASHAGSVSLKSDGRIIASRDFSVDNDLSQKLLLEIDALLASASLEPNTLEKVECTAHEAGLTTTRIGNVVANTMNFVLQSNKKEVLKKVV